MKSVIDKIKSFLTKLIEFFVKNKRALLNAFFMILLLIAVSLVTFGVLVLFEVIYFDDGIKFHYELFESFKNSWYGTIILITILTVLTMLLCVIPGISMAFIILSQALYTVAWQAFLLSFSSVMISSAVMYTLGRYGGYRLCVKMLGKEDSEKSLGLIRDKGTVFFPLMMMFPIFPDDALVMIAGTLRMSLKWFIPSIVVGRGIGIATIIFGLSFIPFDKFTTVWHWIIFVLLCLAAIIGVFTAAAKFNRYMDKRRASGKTSLLDNLISADSLKEAEDEASVSGEEASASGEEASASDNESSEKDLVKEDA